MVDGGSLAGCVTVYGLPGRVGGWVAGSAGIDRIEVCALLSDEIVGRAVTDSAPEPATGHLTFELFFDRPQEPGCLASGDLVIRPLREGTLLAPLPCWEVVEGVDAVAGAMATITRWKEQLGAVFDDIAGRLPTFFPGTIAPVLTVPAAASIEPPAAAPGWSTVDLPVGLLSRTGDAVLGQAGYVFLLRGSNRIIDQYRLDREDPAVLADRDRWLALFARRAAEATRRGIAYVQMVVPEKQSVLPHHLPRELAVEGPTPLLAGIETVLAARPSADQSYLSALNLLTRGGAVETVYGRVDTHLMPAGAYRLARGLLDNLGVPSGAEPVFDVPSTRTADLGDRFFDAELIDHVVNTATPPFDVLRAEKVEEIIPDHSAHLGRRQVWRNPAPRTPRTAVVFGNSFSNFADQGQFYLSYWLAQAFAEYHFLWSPAIDWAYVDAVRADIVFAQTVERFLTMVPES